jgi:hypothetical protein
MKLKVISTRHCGEGYAWKFDHGAIGCWAQPDEKRLINQDKITFGKNVKREGAKIIKVLIIPYEMKKIIDDYRENEKENKWKRRIENYSKKNMKLT